MAEYDDKNINGLRGPEQIKWNLMRKKYKVSGLAPKKQLQKHGMKKMSLH